jgi:hypothetical protein
VLQTQRPDGSWGLWGGTAEETAYALRTLLAVPGATGDSAASPTHVTRALARGYGYLLQTTREQEDPPLWHDKDLYRPTAVVRAAVLGALRLGNRRHLSPGGTSSAS